jgi:hypothetical protein
MKFGMCITILEATTALYLLHFYHQYHQHSGCANFRGDTDSNVTYYVSLNLVHINFFERYANFFNAVLL